MGMQGSEVVDKIKSALPFQTLPLFELADTGIEPYQTPPQENENADFGPNEVTKGSIGEIALDADNPFDTSRGPGELQTCGPPVECKSVESVLLRLLLRRG